MSAIGTCIEGFKRRGRKLSARHQTTIVSDRAMGESNAVRVRRPLMRMATARRAAEIYAERFGTEDGALPATYQVSCMDCPFHTSILVQHVRQQLRKQLRSMLAKCWGDPAFPAAPTE